MLVRMLADVGGEFRGTPYVPCEERCQDGEISREYVDGGELLNAECRHVQDDENVERGVENG